MKNVVVIGGAGHVGLPFSIVVANTGKFNVTGIDLDTEKCHRLNGGEMIYREEKGEEELEKAIASGRLEFTADANRFCLDRADIIAIMIGTPVDAENNPRLDDLFDYFDKVLIPSLITDPKEKLILLRSTVNPGTTELLQKKLDKALPKEHSMRVHLVFAPERVAQGAGIIETGQFPQIIGANFWNDDPAFEIAEEFFNTFVPYGCIRLTRREAEIAKLVTNMTRYVNFALANEFYMIADTFSDREETININKVIKACNKNYPRMNLPLPGPNVGGPCLFKDGKFLTAGVPYGDLINTAFLINEGFVQYLFDKVHKLYTGETDQVTHNLTILGATFKRNSDDIRNSLSFKLAKIAKQKGYTVTMCDPLWKDKDPRNTDFDTAIDSADIIFVMTPHDEFNRLIANRPNDKRRYTFVVDVWKALEFGHYYAAENEPPYNREEDETDDGIYFVAV
jgi:UDP-N-acetyl-D-mannosaminuronic acid dehydrogenase